LTTEQMRELVLDLTREALWKPRKICWDPEPSPCAPGTAREQVLTIGVTVHRHKVTAARENLWDKYRVSCEADLSR
jgi:hypothetical protein